MVTPRSGDIEGGGSATVDLPSLMEVLGFVTEFNANAQIFENAVALLLVAMAMTPSAAARSGLIWRWRIRPTVS